MSIKAIDKSSIHHITSGQVVIDLQTAVKELVENSVDAGATNIEVRFRNHGLTSIEVIDNGCGIAEEDHESIGLKHHTSKLETFEDLASVETFGFRGEALSSLCALTTGVSITTATSATTPMGIALDMDSTGKVTKRSTVARNQGTTITLTNIFAPLAVRRKELERNIKREYAKALALLNAYALGPCAAGPGIRLTVTNQQDKGAKSIQIKTLGSPSCRASVTALWGPKTLDNVVDMDLTFEVEREKIALKRLSQTTASEPFSVQVKGLISKFSVGCGRAGTDRQFFYVNGRPCNMNKVQKAFNEVYRSFNATQSPFIVADFILPTELYDVNVSPDKRTILLHSEGNLIQSLKDALEAHFAPTRATFEIGETQTQSQSRTKSLTQTTLQVSSSKRQLQATSRPRSPSPNLDERIQSSDEEEAPEEEAPAPVVVLDTSQTSWGHRMGLSQSPQKPLASPPSIAKNNNAAPGTPEEEYDMEVDEVISIENLPERFVSAGTQGRREPSPSASSPASSSAESNENNEDNEAEVDEHPRKKRKSDIGAIHVQSPIPSSLPPSRSAGVRGVASRVISAPPSSKASLVHVARSRARELQSQLAGFSRPGTQIKSTPLEGDEDEDEGANQLEEEEMDELEAVDKAQSPPPKNDAQVQSEDDTDKSDDGGIDRNSGEAISSGGGDSDEDAASPNSTPHLKCDAEDTRSPTRTLPVVPPRLEILKREQDSANITLRFDLERTRAAWTRRSFKPQFNQGQEGGENVAIPIDAGVSNVDDGESAASALSRVIEKTDFAKMDIIGQFNLGFIIVRRWDGATDDRAETKKESSNSDDLFIVDQHAADEKYNFETLQATTKIESQKLFKPRPLELTASDEMLAIDNMHILRQNGFEIDMSGEDAISEGSRLKLTAQPVSKSTTFDMKDLEEVIHLLRDRSGSEMVRCSKARAMFAMRACRKSVMVGMPLTLSQMTSVVRHMGTMDQPWNCPHGRPTMRHLIDIRSCGSRSREDIDWSCFE